MLKQTLHDRPIEFYYFPDIDMYLIDYDGEIFYSRERPVTDQERERESRQIDMLNEFLMLNNMFY